MLHQLKWLAVILILGACTATVQTQDPTAPAVEDQSWQTEVEETVKLFGHRNWIVVADGAYPLQSNPSIKTITVDADQLEVVEFVHEAIKQSKHVDATIFLDKELDYVSEEDANGITDYRNGLSKLWEDKPTQSLLHEDIIRQLDQSANLFNVLIIKTNLTIPYTSVFFQLECGYWDAEDEQRLRKALPQP